MMLHIFLEGLLRTAGFHMSKTKIVPLLVNKDSRYSFRNTTSPLKTIKRIVLNFYLLVWYVQV